jgi:membrane protease YdiL (CAAX protease family)
VNSQTQNKKHTVRNLVIFTILVVALGWLGRLLDSFMGAEPGEGLGVTLWIVTPLASSFFLRAFAGDGWKDLGIRPRFRGNGAWYAVSLLIYPVSVALILVIGFVFGTTSIQSTPTDALFQALIALLIKEIIINILEEFAVRGYLAPKMYSLGLNVWAAHALVGLIWGVWHLPVLRMITPYTSESLVTLAPRFVIAAVAASLVYGEIRLLTDSVWPAVCMQTAGGIAVSIAMAFDLFSIKSSSGFLLNPVFESVVMIIIFGLVGVGLYTWRTRRTRSGLAHDTV